ncbi:MAG: substrate-binding periplasmic protein [Gammaproteobacteria bacterium]
MKGNQNRKNSLFSSLVLSLCCFGASQTWAEKITFVADEWYPMNGNPTEKDNLGFMIDLSKAILEPKGYEIDYQIIPWSRSLKSVRSGQSDCGVGAASGDAPDFIFPSNELAQISTKFYVLKDNPWKFTDVASLKGVPIGIINSYSYGDVLDEYIKSNKTNEVQVVGGNDSLEQNIKKLISGRIKAIPETNVVMEAKLKEMNASDQVKEAGLIDAAENLYIACSPHTSKAERAKKITGLLSDGMSELRANGGLKKILDKYNLEDWK